MKDFWVCEYSIYQDQFHVDLMSHIVNTNKDAILNRKCSGYVPIGIFETLEEVLKCAYDFREKHLSDMIKSNGGEWECMGCIHRKIPDYMTHRDICKFKEFGYTCKEIL